MVSTAISYKLPPNLHTDRTIRHAGYITYAREAADHYVLFDIGGSFGFSRSWTVKEVNHPEYVRTHLDGHIYDMGEALKLARAYRKEDLPFMRESVEMLKPRIRAMKRMRRSLRGSFESRVKACEAYEHAAVILV